MNKQVVAALLAVSAVSPLAAANAPGSDLPCVWVKYNLPQAGSNYIPRCSPVNRPSGWDAKITVKHNQPIVGAYYVEAGATVPLPPG